ncbi:hypothetical protein FTUN_5181 [Frigoriglobus tundricola]|uniref:Uncharacterized protein n=1 Tax=Frigoriglobus tundricola TaxID=2774151 RepID=A0A6M5YW37_9BACT|nr:hypothetical protein FTUN_5181 [Frigoriglobus tundricola]
MLGGAFGVGAVLYPQPAAQVVAAGQPGLELGLFAVAAQAVLRWRVRRRISHLPGFTRTRSEPSAAAAPPSWPCRPRSARRRPVTDRTARAPRRRRSRRRGPEAKKPPPAPSVPSPAPSAELPAGRGRAGVNS